jgi:ankyrin repeat protein
VTYLIRGAIFRPRNGISRTGESLEAICTLGELIDMYHTHEASKRHDKVYALLGMSSDDLSRADLLPNYQAPSKELLERLVKFLLHENISVEAWNHKEIAIIRSKGCILGWISSAEDYIDLDGRLGVGVTLKGISEVPGYMEDLMSYWILQAPAKPIRCGDLICLLQGASRPTIIRLHKDHFVIIMITATPIEKGPTNRGYIERLKLLQPKKVFTRDFLLVWDWGHSPEVHGLGDYEISTKTNDSASEHPKVNSERDLDQATRTWNVALILGDSEKYQKAVELLREAIEGYGIAYAQKCPPPLKVQYGLTPLSWAAGNGYDDVVRSLSAGDGVDPDLRDSRYSRTPLSWATGEGHETAVKLLLETGKVLVDSKDEDGQTPLSWAARNGHEATVKLLLEKKADANSESRNGQTPLWRAVEGGHEPVVKLLLEHKVQVDSKDRNCQTLLSWAVREGHEAVVKLLLKTGKVHVDSNNIDGQMLLLCAVQKGHEAVVKLLLEQKANANSKDTDRRTSLSWAAEKGHAVVVKPT